MLWRNRMQLERGYKSKVTLPPSGGGIDAAAKSVYGISVGARSKPVAEIVGGFKWARKFFPNCGVLLGDGLYRITLKIREGLDEGPAMELAIKEGDNLLEEFGSALDEPLPVVFRSSQLMNDAGFVPALALIERLYQRDKLLSEAVRGDAHVFIDRQARRNCLKIKPADAVDLAVSYLKEEVAIYLLMAQRGWLQDIYLGDELPTLLKIVKGEIPNAPTPLKQRISISIRTKGARRS
jgi:tRNA-dependent cyclodipeptide synthase